MRKFLAISLLLSFNVNAAVVEQFNAFLVGCFADGTSCFVVGSHIRAPGEYKYSASSSNEFQTNCPNKTQIRFDMLDPNAQRLYEIALSDNKLMLASITDVCLDGYPTVEWLANFEG